MTDDWIIRGATALDGNDRLAPIDTMFFFRAARLEPEQWTANELSATWARMRPYRELLREAGLRWGPAPAAQPVDPSVLESNGAVLRIGFEDGQFLIRFPYQHDCTAAVRSVEGCRWDREQRAWVLGGTEAALEAITGLVQGTGFALDEQAEAAMAEVKLRAVETRLASRAATGSFAVEGLVCDLRPYQQAGIKYLCDTKKAFLADDMGLGKTVQALATVQALGAWPAVVVTLASCKGGWINECATRLPGVKIVMWEGREGGEEDPVVDAEGQRTLHVINYDLLSYRIETLKALGLKAVIFDEIHHLKNGRAKRTQAAKVLVRRVPVRLGLTGTPVQNEPSELLAPLQILGRLNDLGGFWNFGMRYCEAKQAKHGWDFSGGANLAELHERLRGCCFLRRTKEQVLPELPAKIVTRVPIGMSVDGWSRYETARADILGWLLLKSDAGKAGTDEERAQRVADAIERLDGMELLLRLGTLRQVVAEGKLEPAKEWIREMCASRKLVLFGHHRSGLHALHNEFREELGALLIDGETPSGKRQGIVTEFSKPHRRLFLVNMTAGGTGLDGLQHSSSDVAWLEFPWTPAALAQGTDRLHRLGQKGTVHAWHLTAPGTVDDELLGILAGKAKVCDEANDGAQRKQAAMEAGRSVARWLCGRREP